MASLRGFEPPACRLGGGRSILLSYNDMVYSLAQIFKDVKKPPQFFAPLRAFKPKACIIRHDMVKSKQ